MKNCSNITIDLQRLARQVSRGLAVVACAATMAASTLAFGQSISETTPRQLEGVTVNERLGEVAPLDIPFVDDQGDEVTLRGYLKFGRPIILTPVYYECPMLCNLTLNGLVDGLNGIELSAGQEFEIVSFSFNHEEEPALADVKKRAYLTQYKRESAQQGWHFLTGSEANIKAMCEGLGYGFRWDPVQEEYAHTSTILFITPDGRISRYMNNVKFESRDLKFALIEASQGSIGSPMDKFLLFMCFHYDPQAGSYAASAVKIMRLGGAATLVLMLAGFGVLWKLNAHDRQARAAREQGVGFDPPPGSQTH